MRWLALTIALVGFSGVASAADPTAAEIARDVQEDGAKAVVQRLWSSGEYDRVLAGIAGGNGAWVALAPRLAAGADAGASESLGLALAKALPKNPGGVLSVLDPTITALSPGMVCGVPFIEDTVPDLGDYVRRAEAAVSAVDQVGLRQVRSACLAALSSP